MTNVFDAARFPLEPGLGQVMLRLVLAAVLGGAIGIERQLKHRAAGLRTNMFICFGAALYTLLSDLLATEHIGDHTRIAAQIIPGIGFIGAGTILHARAGLVSGMTTAATMFVVASIGMAAGGGLYGTAIFATIAILGALLLIGFSEDHLNLRALVVTYEVAGDNADQVIGEINGLLEKQHVLVENVQIALALDRARVQFELRGTRSRQAEYLKILLGSSTLASVASLGQLGRE